MSAGAQPKLTKSASESSSAPNREVPLRRRATRPSTPSRTAATTMAITAGSNLPSNARRIAVSPRQSAIRVIMFGAIIRNGTGLKRRGFGSFGSGSKGGKRSSMGRPPSDAPELPLGAAGEIGEQGFACHRLLAEADEDPGADGQI